MGTFQYEVMASPGERVRGRIDAESSAAAALELSRRGYHVLALNEAAPERLARRRALRLKETAYFTRQLARLLRSGVPLAKALHLLEAQEQRSAVRRVLADLRERMQEGAALSKALEAHERSFGAWYVSLVRAGETGGMLDDVLTRLADLLDRESEMRSRIRAALAYPALMTAVGVITVFFLLSFVFPKVTTLFDDAQQRLPMPTLLLMGVSEFFASFWWAVAIGAAVFVLACRAFARSERGARMLSRAMLSLPLFGTLEIRSECARFARVLGTLLGNGVPILQAMESTGATLGNAVLRESTAAMTRHIRQGDPLSRQLEKQRWFPPLMANVVAVGEQSGTLDQVLIDLAREYESDVERLLSSLVSMLEPLLIIVVGGAVGFIVMALLLPIFELNEVIQ